MDSSDHAIDLKNLKPEGLNHHQEVSITKTSESFDIFESIKNEEFEEEVYRKQTRKRLVIISVSSIILVLLILGAIIGILIPIHEKNNSVDEKYDPMIKTICSSTLYKDSCYSSIYSLKTSSSNKNPSPDSDTSKSVFMLSLSAVLTFQQTCRDSVEDHITSNVYMSEMYKKMDRLSELCSNTLALANRITGNIPAVRRNLLLTGVGYNFPSWLSAGDRKLLQSTKIKANAVVAKDGSGDYKTVTEAIQAASGGRFVIYVKAGTYNEKINTNKDGITLIGDGKYSTIITASSSVGKGSTLRGSATFTITGDGFIARDIGFENTAGPQAEQAVALTVVSDHSVLYRCSVAGYQDTLYALSFRQFYRECDIYGTVDFIFGNAAAVFQSCNIVLRRPRSGGAYNVILANGRSDPGQNTGFSVQNCKISIGSDFSAMKNSYKSYLGRPWKQYSRAVVMQSNIDGAISPRGWVEWPGAAGSTYKTLYFAEYENMGAGGGISGRVNWPGFRVIVTAEAEKFTVGNFIGGNSWLPTTGVTFTSGL